MADKCALSQSTLAGRSPSDDLMVAIRYIE
jgi:hypothetical protein